MVTEVCFNVPAVDIGLKDLRQISVPIRANEISRLAIEQLAGLAESVGQGGDNDQTQGLTNTCFFPVHRAEGFNLKGMLTTAGKGRDTCPWDG